MKKKFFVSMMLIICFIIGTVALVACDDKNSTATNYNITIVATEHGKVTADKTTAKEGETVTLTVTPDENYRLVAGGLKVNDVAIEGNTFIMPAKNTSVTAEFEYGNTIPTLTLDNAYEILKNNFSTMIMLYENGNSLIETKMSENAFLTYAKYGDYDETQLFSEKTMNGIVRICLMKPASI